MKVNGTGQPPDQGVSSAEATDKVAQTKTTGKGVEPGESAEAHQAQTPGQAFAEKLGRPRPANAAETNQASHTDQTARAAKVGEAGRTSPTSRAGQVPVQDVAQDLQAGKVTPQAAIQAVLDRVMAQQVGADAPPAVRAQVRAALQDAVEGDPLLAEKLRRL